MLITGKVSKIDLKDESKRIYNVVLHKTRKGKPIQIAIIFWGKLFDTIANGYIKVGERIDVQVYTYSKSNFYNNAEYYSTYLVAQSWRHYVKGKERFKEIVNQKTGEVIKRKDEIVSENEENI